jgi:hypothetical protein
MPETKTVMRSELYAQVWQQSMVQLAKSYAISDVGLAKLCRKHNIPRPGRGYWARKQAGQSPRQARLPDSANDYAIRLRDPDPLAGSSTGVNEDLQVELQRVNTTVEVAATLRGAHEFVSHANQELQHADNDESGFLVVPESVGLDLSVSKATLRRALLLMDAVFKTFEKLGYEVSKGPKVGVMGISVSFGVSEILETKRDELDVPDLDGRYDFLHSRYKETKIPSGRLAITITGPRFYWAGGHRMTWRDAKKPLEERLAGFMEGILKLAARVKDHRVQEEREEQERKEREKRREEEAKRRAEKLALIQAERQRVQVLCREARNWKRSQTIRDYIEAKRQIQPSSDGNEFEQWAEWAGHQADRLDPLQESPHSILDEYSPDLEPPAPRRW